MYSATVKVVVAIGIPRRCSPRVSPVAAERHARYRRNRLSLSSRPVRRVNEGRRFPIGSPIDATLPIRVTLPPRAAIMRLPRSSRRGSLRRIAEQFGPTSYLHRFDLLVPDQPVHHPSTDRELPAATCSDQFNTCFPLHPIPFLMLPVELPHSVVSAQWLRLRVAVVYIWCARRRPASGARHECVTLSSDVFHSCAASPPRFADVHVVQSGRAGGSWART